MLAPNTTRPLATIAADGAVEGYASLFGEVDQTRDMVMPGAFSASLRSRGLRRVPMLFQHDPSEPIGVWLDLHEDYRGLYARGRLIPEVVRARELLALLAAGTADGLSIGFRTVKGRIDPRSRIRKLEAIDLWEISIVTFPLLPGARLALASGASSQREHPNKSAAPDPCVAARHSAARPRAVKEDRLPSRPLLPARTRNALPADPSVLRFSPERFFRRHPRYSFERARREVGWVER